MDSESEGSVTASYESQLGVLGAFARKSTALTLLQHSTSAAGLLVIPNQVIICPVIMLTFRAMFGLTLVAVALIGGGWASWANIQQTKGPRERRFVVRICVSAWLLILSMLGLMYILPPPYRYVVMLFYFFGVPFLIYRWSKTHQLIRLMEARDAEPTAAPPPSK